MNIVIPEVLTSVTPEEKALLEGGTLNMSLYSPTDGGAVSEARLNGMRGGIHVRTHTRFVRFPNHKHTYTEMMIVLSGSITHKIGDRAITLSEGEILFLNKHIEHSLERAGKSDVGVNVIISDEFLDTVAAELSNTVFSSLIRENRKAEGAGMLLHFTTGKDKRIINLIENLLAELTVESRSNQISSRTVALLLLYLSERSEELLLEATESETRAQKQARATEAYLASSYRTATLGELAARLGLTVPYLSRLIKNRFGASFLELLTKQRLKKAKELLLATDMSVGEVIRAVGYENDSYFHRIFRERYGTTPLNMRKNKQ